jgi:predicted Zn-dependent protease
MLKKGSIRPPLAGVDRGRGSRRGDDRGRRAAMMANQMMQLKYGRNDESEADHYGLKDRRSLTLR